MQKHVSKFSSVDSDFGCEVGNREYIAFLWKYARNYKGRIVKIFILSLPLSCLTALVAWLFKQIIELVTNNNLAAMLKWILLALAITIVKGILEVTNRYLMTKLDMHISNDIRNELHEAIHNSSLNFHLRTRSGEIASLISNDVNNASSGLLELFVSSWLNPAIILSLLGVMIYFNPLISILAVISIPVVAISVSKISKLARIAESRFLSSYASLLGVMVESLTNIKQVKSLSIEKQQKEIFAEQGMKLIRYRIRATFLKSLTSPIAEICSGFSIVLMLLVSYWQLSKGNTTYGAIAGSLGAAYGLKKPIKAIATSFVQLQKSVAAVQRISWVFNNSQDNADEKSPIETPIKTLEFKQASFTYDGRSSIVKDVNAKFNIGEKIAIFGSSGSGKTTLIDLIIGFYPCTKGALYIDDANIKSIDRQQWRNQIGIVTQDPFLFDVSIKENILMGFQDATDQQIKNAIHLAGADEIIDRLANGIETKVGERGSRLSGGERKRIALARALVRPISILILDEATSELDAAVEAKILKSVDSISEKILVLYVSHNPTILRHCDRAFYLNNAEINEVAPDELIKQSQNANKSFKAIRKSATL